MKLKTSLIIFALFVQISAGYSQTRVAKGINYTGVEGIENTLNIYHKRGGENQDVIVFIHGGSWSSGKKETYWWLGRNLAKKDIVAVLINYPLAPQATFKEMAMASAKAVKWVKDSIAVYGGNPNRIFLMGHSAGGHLCELINSDTTYFKSVNMDNPIKGLILNDAFGLDMEEYLTKAEKDDNYVDFLRTFSDDPKNWQLGSPLFYVKNVSNPHLLFYGSETYEAIKIQTERIYKNLNEQHVPVKLQVIEGKKHVGMISQMIFGGNQLYQSIVSFLKEIK